MSAPIRPPSRPENPRGPLAGVGNIVRFNWPFYALAAGAALLLGAAAAGGPAGSRPYAGLALLAVLAPTALSLLASWYVYDHSNLYRFDWLPPAPPPARLVNIHAGFDETSALLQAQFPGAALRVFDFYDPRLHTEASIRRARAAVAPYPGTAPVRPAALPLPPASTDQVFVLLAAHEIRDPAQRVAFLREIGRVLAPGGRAVVVEHLRDPANFLAYTVGFLHFYARATWRAAFRAAGLRVAQELKITPFVSAFVLHNPADVPAANATPGNAS